MDVRVRCCGLGPNHFAADMSHIGETVVRNYLDSEDYKLSIEGKLTMGYLTHRGRNIESQPSSIGNPAQVKKLIGRDDTGLCVGQDLPTFTHYVKEFYIENVPNEGPFLMALVHIFDEKDFDHIAAENIRRLKGLIRSGVRLTCSLVILSYWENNGNGVDEAKRIKLIKSLDWTVNPSFGPLARITEVIDDEDEKKELTKTFSDIESDTEFVKSQPKEEGEIKVKVYSDLNAFGCNDLPKSSKIDGKFCTLKVKEFSSVCSIINTVEEEEPVQKMESEIEETGAEERDFSVVSVRERLRESKLSPRMYFRRTYISYRQVVRQLGSKMDQETANTLKGLFTSDVLYVLQKITPDVIAGKPLSTLLGAGALGKDVRQAAQKLQIPFRMAMNEAKKQGFVSKMRYQKLQSAYMEFINSLLNDVFTNSSEIPSEEDLAKKDEESKEK